MITVGPDGLLRRRLFTAMAIALALAAWSIGGQSDAEVRARVNPWTVVGATAQARWNALRDWAAAAGRGALWPSIVVDASWTRRDIAHRVAQILISRGPPVHDDLARVFAGSAHIR